MNRLILLFAALLLLTMASPETRADLVARKVEKKKLYENVYAVCIGVDQQQYGHIPTLQFAGADAQAIHHEFSERYGYNSKLLIGKQATHAAILKKIRLAARGAGPNDVLLIYFAGHGVPIRPDDTPPHERQGYLVAYDSAYNVKQSVATFAQADKLAVPMRDIVKLAVESKAKHVLLILDCCFSGIAASPQVGQPNFVTADESSDAEGPKTELELLLGEPTRQVFTAGTSKQKSLELPEIGHGLFTYHLLEQMRRDKQNVQSLQETFGKIRRKVIRASIASGGQMTPQLRPLYMSDGDWVFIHKDVADDSLTLYEASAQDGPTSEQDLGEFKTATTRSLSSEPEDKKENDPDAQAQFRKYETRAAMGDPVAMAGLQYCYENGIGTPRDPEKAFYWANESYDYDRTESRLGAQIMAHSYEKGIGTPRNPEQAQSIRDAAGLVQLIGEFSDNPDDAGKVAVVLAFFTSGANDKAKEIVKQTGKARIAASDADADDTRKALDKLKRAINQLRAESKADENFTPEQTAAIAELCDTLTQGLKKAARFEKFGIFAKVDTALGDLDPTLNKLNQMFNVHHR